MREVFARSGSLTTTIINDKREVMLLGEVS